MQTITLNILLAIRSYALYILIQSAEADACPYTLILILSYRHTAAELGNWNPANMVSLQPNSMEEQEPTKVSKSSSGYGSSVQQKSEETKRTKRRRQPVPDERKDGRYWERRRKNNVAARRSRESRRLKQEQDLLKAEQAIQENIRLRAEVDVLKSEICSLRRLLKDANTTLSLWIKARQATEPVHQLPPNLRDKNGPLSFVNFPM